MAGSAAELLERLSELLPPRAPLTGAIGIAKASGTTIPVAAPKIERKSLIAAVLLSQTSDAVELAYEPADSSTPATGADLTDALYEGYTLGAIRIPGAKPHPTLLVQSAAMASVMPPMPSYRPHLPSRLATGGVLSDAQLESVVYAGEAHARHLAGAWCLDESFDNVHAAAAHAEDAVRFRRGWFLGDGTGCGKGRQVSGIILDNWFKGRRKAIWISKSDKLIEDARREWAALGQEPLLVQPLSRFKQGTPITLAEGILFCTYATLRSAEREGKISRLQQIVDCSVKTLMAWIVFDEAHALANGAGGKGGRGEVMPSQQGRAGLRFAGALPDARIVYVSATGATDVRILAL